MARWRFGNQALPGTKAAPGSFGAVVLPHLDAAHNLARWLVADASLAEDVVQDAALKALDYFGSFRGGDGRAWLLRIVRNAAYDALAHRRRHRADRLDDADGTLEGQARRQLADPADDPEMVLTRRQGAEGLDRALAALPLELRECLVLREFEELSYREIAQIAGGPVGTGMSRLWRARRALMGGAEGSPS